MSIKNIFSKTKSKKLISLMLVWIMVLTASGCSAGTKESQLDSEEGVVKVYYINNTETSVVTEDYTLTSTSTDTEGCVEELLEQMKTIPAKLEYEAPITGDVVINEYSISDEFLTLDFNSTYNNLDTIKEKLVRAAIVSTLTQIDGIEYVDFLIDGTPLEDSTGIVGNMNSDMFVYNAGNEINTYEKVELTLYFANSTGDKLVQVYRSIVYNSNILKERLIIEQLISGPNSDISCATINPETSINSVSVRDGVCYIDFDDKFMEQPNDVTPEVAIYSLVNSVAEITDVNRVQISVNGDSNVMFMDSISLSKSFERNLDIILK